MERRHCSHCNLEFSSDLLQRVLIDDRELYFCCNGCRSVYILIKTHGLDSFYDRLRGRALNTSRNISHASNKSINYSSINFKERYVRSRPDGLLEVRFFIDGIVCAACVWLNEQTIVGIDGVREFKVNYTSHRAYVLFDERVISFSEIVDHIANIGYGVTVFPYRDDVSARDNRIHLTRLVVAIFCTMNVMWVNVGQYAGYFSGIGLQDKNILNLASFLLASPVLFFSAGRLYKSAFYSVKNKMIGMDFLVVSGTSIVYIYSIFSWLVTKQETYFESVCMIITFVLGAKFLESKVRVSADENLDRLSSMLPLEARLSDGQLISVNDVKVGFELLALPGEMIAFDGVLLSDMCVLDCSNITGESMDVSKRTGESITSGSICMFSPVLYRVASEFEHSSISKLARLLENLAFTSPRISDIAHKVSGIFSRFVVVIAIVGFFLYLLLDYGFTHSLLVGVSVIIIACPCALALATPIASVAGLNRAFRNRVVFKSAVFLETLGKVNTVVLDKTGTLTSGDVSVDSFNDLGSEITLGILKKLNAINPHRIASAINDFLSERGIVSDVDSSVFDFKLLDGNGFSAKVSLNTIEYDILGGNERLLDQCAYPCAYPLEQNDRTVFALLFRRSGFDHFKLAFLFYLSDSIKEDAYGLVSHLKSMGKDLIILSGDRESVVRSVALNLGVCRYYSGYTPLNKADFIKYLAQDRARVVAMVGDGLNDSLAISYAHVGIVMGGGSDASISHSDVIILDDRLDTLLNAFKISSVTLRAIKQNLALSIIYNSLAIPLALSGLVIPLFAAIFMSLSSLSVVLNSIRQNWQRL